MADSVMNTDQGLMSMVGDYAKQFVGDTVGKPIEDIRQGKYLEGAVGLGNLFTKPAAMLMSPSSSEAAIRPLSATQAITLDKILKKLNGAPVNERDLFVDHGFVRSGKNSWGHFTPDVPTELMKKIESNADFMPEGVTTRLKDLFNTKMPVGTDAIVRKVPFSDQGTRGVMRPAGPQRGGKYQHDYYIDLNSNASNPRATETVQHELQHVLDKFYGKSYGANYGNFNTVSSLEAALKGKVRPEDYSSLDHYLHNIGEVRARQNEFLNTRPDMYTGIDSVFRGVRRPYHPDMLWGE